MKKLLLLCCSLLLCMGLVACSTKNESKVYKIGIVTLMDHTSLNTIRDAILDELKAEGYIDGENVEIDFQNANQDTSTLKTICEQFKSKKVDIIIAITTPAAQAAAPYAEEIPVIFSAVSDPIEAGLVNDREKPDMNITGTSDEVQVSSIMNLAREMYPETKTIGYIYNAGEANSVSNRAKLESYAKENALNVKTAAVTSVADVSTGLQSLINDCDIIFSPTDNTVASAMDQVREICNNAKVPFFTGADSMVQDGGLATYGINYESLGKETANMAIKVLNGTKVEDLPVKVFKDDLDVYFNKTTAAAIGYQGLESLQENYNVILFE